MPVNARPYKLPQIQRQSMQSTLIHTSQRESKQVNGNLSKSTIVCAVQRKSMRLTQVPTSQFQSMPRASQR